MSFKVYLVGRSNFDVDSFISFMNNQKTTWKRTSGSTESEEIAEIAGRICYMSFGKNQSSKSNSDYIRSLILRGHESILEHLSWTFLITGVSRAFTHQLVRHRVGFSFSQLSQQYYAHTDAEFVTPSLLKKYPKALDAWRSAVKGAKETYRNIFESLSEMEKESNNDLKKKEIKRAMHSASRSILPNATATIILVTANARAMRYFLKVRGSIPGDEEMRRVSSEILRLLLSEAPAFFFDFRIEKLSDGSDIVIQKEATKNRKVS